MYQYTKAQRLKTADEFSSVFIFRKTRYTPYFKIHFKPNELGYSRLGLIVSKKIHKRAVKRNYMKRLIRELFRYNCQNWDNYDVVFRVQKCFTVDNYPEISHEFKKLTNKLLKALSNAT